MKTKAAIRKKVSSLIIKISLSSLIAVGFITIGAMLILRANTVSASGTLGDMAAGDSQIALEEISIRQLLTLAESRAALSDTQLQRVQNGVSMIAAEAGNIMRNPERYLPNPAAPPNAANAGIVTAQFVTAQGVNLDDIEEEAALMGNMQSLLYSIMENIIHNRPGTSAYIGFEKGYFIAVDAFSDEGYFDPRGRPWYRMAVENNALSWTDIFPDVFGQGLSITCAMPFHDRNGNIAGVAGIGNRLDEVIEIVVGTDIGETGYAFMLNELGQIIISPNILEDETGNIIREDWLNSDNAELAAVARAMVDGETGIARITRDGNEYFIAYSPLTVLPWSLAAVIEVAEVIAPALETSENIISMRDDALYGINLIITIVITAFVGILAIIVLIISFMSQRFSNALTKPIMALQEGVHQIAEGNLDYSIDIHTGDEIEDLGVSVGKMANSLKDYIDDLQRVTADKERIGAELNVATRIQASMLPSIFPAFPGKPEIDLYATMIPAKEVGGDFYDFFLIDDEKVAVVMADVSGKGVPAALFMVIAKTLIKNNAQNGHAPREVFEIVNNLLCENNEADMFVTAFMGILDIPTRKFSYVNAGHNPPLIKRSGGRYEWLPTKPGFVIAGMEGMSYQQDEIILQKGDAIFMYTDGVTEATNPADDLFGDAKLLEVANKQESGDLKDFLARIKTEIDVFADGAEQADDITMSVMKLTGGEEN
jgi:sigma-B regulation protein RsbU (phosphoserine phosphatase)